MTLKIPDFLWPTIVGVSVYIIVNRLFPEKVEPFEKDPLKDLRGGSKAKLFKELLKHLSNDKALKIALVSTFATAGVRHFNSEIQEFLAAEVFRQICVQDADGKLKVVCDIIQKHDLNSYTKSMRSVILANNLTQEQKISLLKIKLDFIINGECCGKTRFLVVAILGVLIACTISGVGGLALILEALYRLFQEGRLGKALFKQLMKALARKYGAEIPNEYFPPD